MLSYGSPGHIRKSDDGSLKQRVIYVASDSDDQPANMRPPFSYNLSPSMDLSTLRSQIKSWEHDFKAQNARHPSVQDIKVQPHIGITSRSSLTSQLTHLVAPVKMYKLYKKLSKAAATGVETNLDRQQPLSADPPSTPLKSSSDNRVPLAGSLLLSKPRVVEKTAPSFSYNPFSPIKSKGKSVSRNPSRANPLCTPSKGNVDSISVQDASPDELPIMSFQPIPSTSSASQPLAGDAVSRARKRLRGEPVSPSPNKEKKRRTSGSHISLPFARISPRNDDDNGNLENEMDEMAETNSSFIDDSPLKAPAGNKSFKLLFEEAMPSPMNGVTAKRKGSLSRSMTASASTGLFGDRIARAAIVSSLSKEEMDQDLGADTSSGDKDKPYHKKMKRDRSSSSENNDLSFGRTFNSASTRFSVNTESTQELNQYPSTSASASRTSTKRPLSDDEDEQEDAHGNSQIQPSAPILIPPSPPPADSSSPGTSSTAFKGKGKAVNDPGSRKKVKLLEVSEDEEDTPKETVKLVTRHKPKRRSDEDDIDCELLGYKVHRASRERSHQDPKDGFTATPPYQSGKFEVDLPDEFKRVLNISPSGMRESREERVVKGLLSGRRVIHYDPGRGGEIWDVGEEDEDRRGVVEDGDWEGEPVPWEGEL